MSGVGLPHAQRSGPHAPLLWMPPRPSPGPRGRGLERRVDKEEENNKERRKDANNTC